MAIENAIYLNSEPSLTGRAFLTIVAIATFAIDVSIAYGLAKKLRSKSLGKTDKAALALMSIGAVLFGGAVELACLTMLATGQPVSLWPHACRLGVTFLSYIGIGAVVLGIVVNVRSAFR